MAGATPPHTASAAIIRTEAVEEAEACTDAVSTGMSRKNSAPSPANTNAYAVTVTER